MGKEVNGMLDRIELRRVDDKRSRIKESEVSLFFLLLYFARMLSLSLPFCSNHHLSLPFICARCTTIVFLNCRKERQGKTSKE